MKKFAIFLILTLLPLYSKSQEISDNNSSIYIFRPEKKLFALDNLYVVVNNSEPILINMGETIRINIALNSVTKLTLRVVDYRTNERHKDTDILNSKFEAGKSYYYSIDPSLWKAGFFFEDATKNKEKFLKAKNVKTYYDITPEEIANLKIIKNHPRTNWSESEMKRHWVTIKPDLLEGIYEVIGGQSQIVIGLIKENENYIIVYASGSEIPHWKEGDLKAELTKTAIQNIFKIKWYSSDKRFYEGLLGNENGVLTLKLNNFSEQTSFIKLYPTYDDDKLNSKVFGTGFALTANGLFVTNYHVIQNGKKIKIHNIINNMTNSYNAETVIVDKNNDLAILKIDQAKFSKINYIPYEISTNVASPGENIFVLGYPLPTILGNEIKLTSGIVSSKTGFQDDISSYQISAPVQPGNSGGPLFNSKGQLIGIINAKYNSGENVTYAIKSNYLLNLINLLDNKLNIEFKNDLIGKSVSEQYELLKNLVFIVEVQ